MMPVIYGTDELKRKAIRLMEKYPDADVVILLNSVMGYAFGSSARHICRKCYPGTRPRDMIVLARDNVLHVTDTLLKAGLEVGVCDLDEPKAK
jgi:hypothetical protein